MIQFIIHSNQLRSSFNSSFIFQNSSFYFQFFKKIQKPRYFLLSIKFQKNFNLLIVEKIPRDPAQ